METVPQPPMVTNFRPHPNTHEQTTIVDPAREPIFSTKDIVLASTLLCLKFFMTNISYELGGSRRTPTLIFSFDNTPMLQDAIRKYIQSMLAVEPKAFMQHLKGLKGSIENYREEINK